MAACPARSCRLLLSRSETVIDPYDYVRRASASRYIYDAKQGCGWLRDCFV